MHQRKWFDYFNANDFHSLYLWVIWRVRSKHIFIALKAFNDDKNYPFFFTFHSLTLISFIQKNINFTILMCTNHQQTTLTSSKSKRKSTRRRRRREKKRRAKILNTFFFLFIWILFFCTKKEEKRKKVRLMCCNRECRGWLY